MRQETAAEPEASAEAAALVRALQDPTRRGILLRFYEDPGPRTVDEVAADAGVHRTVAFSHLEQLAGLGYLAVDRRRGRLGKPAKLYRLSAPPISFHHPARRFTELSGVLARGLEGLGEPGRSAAVDAGRAEGHRLAAGAHGAGEALERLAPLGAGYMRDGDVVEARNCVFREACAAAPLVVCGVQAGILAGALEEAGDPCDVVPMGSTPDGRGCRYRVLPR